MGSSTLAMQFEDALFTVSSMNPNRWTIWSEPKDMIKLHLIRGYQNTIYFAEKDDAGDKVFKLWIEDDEVRKAEVYQLPGSELYALEADSEIMKYHKKQGIYLVDRKMMIYHIV